VVGKIDRFKEVRGNLVHSLLASRGVFTLMTAVIPRVLNKTELFQRFFHLNETNNCKEVRLAFHLLLTLEEVFTLIVATILIAMGKTDRFKEVTVNLVFSMLVFHGSFILLPQAPPRMPKIKKVAFQKVFTLMVAATPRMLIEIDPIQGSFTVIIGTIHMVHKKTVGYQWRLTNEPQQQNAELQRQCAELRRTKKCLKDSQRKMQQLERRNEELEEIMKHQNECKVEVKIPKNQPRPRHNIQLLVTIALQIAKVVLE